MQKENYVSIHAASLLLINEGHELETLGGYKENLNLMRIMKIINTKSFEFLQLLKKH